MKRLFTLLAATMASQWAQIELPAIAQTPSICAEWTRVNTMPRSDMAMAYDSSRHVTVMFGGSQSDYPSKDTREWDGQQWTLRSQNGPAASTSPRMAFDESRYVCVLVTGDNETWEWDGNAWALRAQTGPTPQRRSFALAYDAARRQTVLFGGRAGNSDVNDTWVWDGQAWSLAATNGPPPRDSHAMAYDPDRQCVVMFGGQLAGQQRWASGSDTWDWNGRSWTQRATTGPGARYGHAMAFSHSRHHVLLLGGLVGNSMDAACWEWNGSSWTIVPTNGCPPRWLCGFVEDSLRGLMVCFGGADTVTMLGDTQELSFQGNAHWTQRASTMMPAPRRDAAMALDTDRGVPVLFGGDAGNNTYFNETWEFNGQTWVLRGTSGPASRGYAAMAYDAGRHVTVLYGGQGYAGTLGDTWEWNGATWTQRATTGPHWGAGARMVYDPSRLACVLFGGNTNNSYSNETWTWDGQVWTHLQINGPSARAWHALAYDSERRAIVLHGGVNNVTTFGDTWELAAGDWVQRPAAPDFRRYFHQMIFDDASGQMVGVGGFAWQTPYVGDMWRLDDATPGAGWTQLPDGGPPLPRLSHELAIDPIRHVALLFGGMHSLGGTVNDTWELDLHAKPHVVQQPTGALAAVHAALLLTMSADGPGPFTYQWRRNGTNLSPDDHLSGVTSSSLAIDPVTFGDAGTYDVLVSNDCGATASQGATVVVYQPGDANGDHHVNLNDLLAVISTWGPCPAPPTSCPADIAPPQGDGTVNVNDLLVVILNWGT